MSALQLEQRNVCGCCGNSETSLFAEFNSKMLCTECFKKEIENHVQLVLNASGNQNKPDKQTRHKALEEITALEKLRCRHRLEF